LTRPFRSFKLECGTFHYFSQLFEFKESKEKGLNPMSEIDDLIKQSAPDLKSFELETAHSETTNSESGEVIIESKIKISFSRIGKSVRQSRFTNISDSRIGELIERCNLDVAKIKDSTDTILDEELTYHREMVQILTALLTEHTRLRYELSAPEGINHEGLQALRVELDKKREKKRGKDQKKLDKTQASNLKKDNQPIYEKLLKHTNPFLRQAGKMIKQQATFKNFSEIAAIESWNNLVAVSNPDALILSKSGTRMELVLAKKQSKQPNSNNSK
jgi:hypothetical protein